MHSARASHTVVVLANNILLDVDLLVTCITCVPNQRVPKLWYSRLASDHVRMAKHPLVVLTVGSSRCSPYP
jgi:hypothetical protein